MSQPPEKQNHRILITGGGTGGHLYPAIAVMQQLQKDETVEAILYIGNQNKPEATLVPEIGIRFYGIQFEGLKKSWRLFIWPFLLLLTTIKVILVLRLFKPTVIFATGGYVIAPVLLAANILKIPYVIHEPDAHAGKANRMFASGAQRITCGFEGALKTFGKKAVCTGNPVRAEFGLYSKEEALQKLGLEQWDATKPVILIIGGSQGARKINNAILNCQTQLISSLPINFLHQTGQTLFQDALKHFSQQKPPAYYHLAPFIKDMASAYACADIVISRSGAMSLAEIYAAGLPSILIPYPYATANHQRKNAETAVKAGAAEMILDKDLTSETLQQLISKLLSNPAKRSEMKDAAQQLAKLNATQDIVTIIKNASVLN